MNHASSNEANEFPIRAGFRLLQVRRRPNCAIMNGCNGGQANLVHGIDLSGGDNYPDREMVPLSYEKMRARSQNRLLLLASLALTRVLH